jgi:dynein heavy chain
MYKVAIDHMRPTPTKSHYLFNLRDISKVILGICMADKDSTQKQESLVRLWVHETLRVFSDRLIDEVDRQMMLDKIREIVRRQFNLNFDNIFEVDYSSTCYSYLILI